MDLQWADIQNKDLLIERDNLLVVWDDLLAQRVKLVEENTYLGNEVYNEHVVGFEKGIVQYAYFFWSFDLDHEGYDVIKMVVNRQMMDVPLSTAQEEVSASPIEEPQRIEVVVQDINEEAGGGEE